MMNNLFLLVCAALCTQTCLGQLKRVGYYTNWSQYRPTGGSFFPEHIDVTLCDYFIFVYAYLEDNRIVPYEWNDQEMWGRFITHVHAGGSDKQAFLGVGGWNMPVAEWSSMLSTEENRKEFIDSSILLLRLYGFDGLDLDFMYPGSHGSPVEDVYRYTFLVQEFRVAIEQEAVATGWPKLYLTAAVAAKKVAIDAGYQIPEFCAELDFVSVLAYDLTTDCSWTGTSHNSPLYPRADQTVQEKTLNVDWAADYWYDGGCPKEKLIIGMAAYGRGMKLEFPYENGMGAPCTGSSDPGAWTRESGFYSFYEVCNWVLNQGAVTDWDDEHMVPYGYEMETWVGFDDPQSLTVKVDWLLNNSYAGWMVWSFDLDDFTGVFCLEGPYPLISALNEAERRAIATRSKTAGTINASRGGGGEVPAPDDNFCLGTPDGTYAHEKDCAWYYECEGGKANVRKCSDDRLYAVNERDCVLPDSMDQGYLCAHCTEYDPDNSWRCA